MLFKRPALSQMEMEVLRLLIKGCRNREIAAALDIVEDTVKARLKTLFAKLRVGNRTEAVIVAIRLGIVHLEEKGKGYAIGIG